MFGDYDDYEPAVAKDKKVKVFLNGDPLANPVTLRIVKQTRLREIQKSISEKYPSHFTSNRFRLFDQEGVEIFQDDLEYLKNNATIFASAGEDFDSSSTFSEYEMIKELGQGGFGKVLLGQHRITKEKVAIKIVKTNLIGNAQDIDMVFREAEIMKSLQHKNIVRINNCFTLSDMRVVFIMEYLEGGELLGRIEEKGMLPEDEAKEYFTQIVEAMVYCHRNKLIHRDLKLENILLTSSNSNEIKIVDFGIAGCVQNAANVDAGSLRYMPPEVLSGSGKKITCAVDIWAMGVILFSIVTGELPFNSSSSNVQIKEAICEASYKFPSSVAKSLSAEVKDIIHLMLDVNPETRITAVDLLNHPWIAKKSTLNLELEESKEDYSAQSGGGEVLKESKQGETIEQTKGKQSGVSDLKNGSKSPSKQPSIGSSKISQSPRKSTKPAVDPITRSPGQSHLGTFSSNSKSIQVKQVLTSRK